MPVRSCARACNARLGRLWPRPPRLPRRGPTTCRTSTPRPKPAAAHNRVAIGYLRTGNADLAGLEIERLREAWRQGDERGQAAGRRSTGQLYVATLTDASHAAGHRGHAARLRAGPTMRALALDGRPRRISTNLRTSAGVAVLVRLRARRRRRDGRAHGLQRRASSTASRREQAADSGRRQGAPPTGGRSTRCNATAWPTPCAGSRRNSGA